jgi:hypothetical protein
MTDPTERKDPPENAEEWAYLWRGAERANDGWVIIGPIVAVVRNWKAWAIGLAFFLWINRPDVLEALRAITGAKP